MTRQRELLLFTPGWERARGVPPQSPGREHGSFPLPKNEPYPISLEHSFASPWQQNRQSWREQYEQAPVRLEITSVRRGYEPWILTPEVKVHYDPAFMLGVG